MRGKVTYYDTEKQRGFGFITPEGGQRIYVHCTQIVSTPRPIPENIHPWLVVGELVEFDVDDSEKGPCAKNVRVLTERVRGTLMKVFVGKVLDGTPQNFGFIAPDDGGPDAFFLDTDLVEVTLGDLRQGDRVEYDHTLDAERGHWARRVKTY